MKKLVGILLAVQTIAWSTNSLAGWYYDVAVQRLYAGNAGGRHAVKLVGLDPNPENCQNSFDLFIDANNPKFREMWSMLLSAYMADKRVGIYISGCGGPYNTPIVTDVIIGKYP